MRKSLLSSLVGAFFLLLAPATGGAAELPTSLAGYKLGSHVKLSGDENNECQNKGGTFLIIHCDTTKAGELWSIDAVYSREAVAGTSFDGMLAARQKKYGAPTKISEDVEDCNPGVSASPAMSNIAAAFERKCAIWENANIKMVLYFEQMAAQEAEDIALQAESQSYRLGLISKPLMAQHDREAADAEGREQTKSKKNAEKQAEKLLDSE